MAVAAQNIPQQSASDRLRARAVWLYYGDGVTQSDIAKQLGINRIMVVRLLAEARRRNEVRITISSTLGELARLELGLAAKYGIAQVIIAPNADPAADPIPVIAAATGAYLSSQIRAGMTVGVGWGRTLYASLPFVSATALDDVRVVSLLGGIAAARRYNPAEFAWKFAELFQAEGFLIPAPAVVDSPETRDALLERCGLSAIFRMANEMDMAILSVGDIGTITTSYRTGHLTAEDRAALIEAGAVGDVLYNFIAADGHVVDHEVNRRVVSADLEVLRRTPVRVLASGGSEKQVAIRAAIHAVQPTVLITDEQSALRLADEA